MDHQHHKTLPPTTPSKSAVSKISRLPVLRRVSSVSYSAPPDKIGSLRPQSFIEPVSLSKAPNNQSFRNFTPPVPPPPPTPSQPREFPIISRRTSSSRLTVQGDRAFTDATASSIAKATPRRIPSNGCLNGVAPLAPALRNRVSTSSLQSQSSNTQILHKKSSAPILESPLQSPTSLQQSPRISATPKGRRTSDINGTVAPPLNRRPSNTQLKQPLKLVKRQSLSQISSNRTTSILSPTTDASPTPFRRVSSAGLPAIPQTPTLAKSIRAPQPVLRLANRTVKPEAVQAPPTETVSPKKSDHKKASESLRNAIRQARAAKRAVSVSKGDNNGIDVAAAALDGFDFGTDDPFNQAMFSTGGTTKILTQRIQTARVEGRLNISNLQLKEIPLDVYKMYETVAENTQTDDNGPKWYESVDLAKLVGADNEIEMVGEELAVEFGGLISIDMHNNALVNLPSNFAQLTELTVLNLSNNKLDTAALEIIFQISSLKDLKLAKNCLEGDLSASISKLSAVESLELQDNKLSSLPASLGECTSLRVLNVSKNALKVFPVEHLNSCPIQDLDVSNNKISGVFFPSSVERWDSLQSLNIKMNRVTAFSESSITLPALDQLFLSNNLMIDFPAVGHCDQLLVLLVDDNHISMLSTEIYNLRQLRTLDFSSNDIKVIDPRLGGMDSLQVINFAGNPLLDRKLAGMSTANLKKVLKGRLAPPEIVIAAAEDDEDDIENMGLTYSDTVVEKALEVGRAGLLDLSNKAYSELSSELMGSVIGSPVTMLLSHNSLTSFPTSLDIFASLSSLDMSFNKLSSDYLPEKLVLRSLETLNLHSTTIISLEQLFKSLDAPKLQTLDISANRVTSIAGVRQAFPVLMNLHASDNQIEEIPLESVDGIRVLDLSGNSISVLPPRLALSSNLRELKVHGNTFRVPRWQVLDKGTQAVLSWLKDRLPADEAEAEQFD